jgi:hypothetical protein
MVVLRRKDAGRQDIDIPHFRFALGVLLETTFSGCVLILNMIQGAQRHVSYILELFVLIKSSAQDHMSGSVTNFGY